MRLSSPHVSTALVSSMVLLGLAGCGDKVATYEPITDPAELFMELTLDHRAVTMAVAAPYNTLRLTATPRDAHGNAIEGLPVPKFTSSDTTVVRVSPEGLLTALQPGMEISVVAEVTVPGNVRHVDTARVNVTEVPPAPFELLSMDVVEPDSAVVSVLNDFGTYAQNLALYTFMLATNSIGQDQLKRRVAAFDAAQNPMAVEQMVLEFRSLDPSVATVARWSGEMSMHRTGQAPMVVRATAYGVTRADTLTFTVRPPAVVTIPIGTPGESSLFGPDRTIRKSGVVMWVNVLDRPVSVVYDDQAGVLRAADVFCDWAPVVAQSFLAIPVTGPFCSTGGNITIPATTSATDPKAVAGTGQLQQFPEAGTYTYHDAETGATGHIIVTDAGSE